MAKRPVPKYDFKAFGAAIKAAREGRKESRKKVGDEMFISPRYLANIENKGQHPSLQIFFELIQRYHISVDQFLLETPPEKNTQRRQLDALLDGMSDTGIRIVTATAKEISEVEKEIGQFVNELSEVSLDSFTEAFEMASRKIQEYPHCDLLIYTIATVLNGSLTLSDLNDEERMEYNTAIIEWLERTADSQDERVRNSSVFILATKYVQMEKYEEANALLKKIPDTVIDATIMKTSVLAHQEGTDTAALFLEGKLLQAVINIQSYLYKLIEMEEETGNHDKAEKIAEITDHMISLFGLWNYGNTVPYLLIAGYRKDVEKCIQLIKRLLSESQKPWNMTQSPLYYRYEDTAQGKAFSGLGKNFVRELYSEIENKKEYEFLRGNKELESIFEEHLK